MKKKSKPVHANPHCCFQNDLRMTAKKAKISAQSKKYDDPNVRPCRLQNKILNRFLSVNSLPHNPDLEKEAF